MAAFLTLAALAFLFGPWIALIVVNRGRKRDEEIANERWLEISHRVSELESELRALRMSAVRDVPMPEQPKEKSKPVAIRPMAPPAWSAVSDVVEHENVSQLPSPEPSSGRGLNLEEALGTDWLNKIGIVILIIGIAMFLVYQLRQIGAAGKILVGLAVSATLLGGGIALEKRPVYKIIGRAGIGGGWALAFFTTYAMYHVEVTRVLNSQLPDLALMLTVAAAMVAHTLRYRSQVVTGLAFLLAFSTLTISQVTVYSLSAEIVLALGLVVIVSRMKWYALEAFGIAAAYLNHWWWVRRIIEPMGSHKHPFPEFGPSVAILLLYWAIFRVSYIIRKCDDRDEKISAGAALLNSVGLLAVLKYQSVHPEWAFRALLAMGATELGLALLPITRRRRAAFVILATIGIALLLAAVPFRFTGGALDALWIFEAEALLAAGIAVNEILYRRLAMLASVLAGMDILSSSVATLAGLRYYGLGQSPNFIVAGLCLAAAAMFLGNSHWVTRQWPRLFEHTFDRTVIHRFSFAGAFMLYAALWAAFPGMRTAPAWAIAGLGLLIAGARLKLDQLPFEAHFFFTSALMLALWLNLPNDESATFSAERIMTVSLIAALLYAGSRWSGQGLEVLPRTAAAMPAAYRWAATGLLILLIYYDVAPISRSPAYAFVGLLLLESGLRLNLKDLRLQAYATLLLAFGAIFFVNLNAESAGTGVLPVVYTVMPVAMALYYAYLRVTPLMDPFEVRFRVKETAAWCGAITVAALLRFVLSPDWVAGAWAAGASTLLAVAVISRGATFLHQAVFFCFVAAFRAALHNLYERSYLPGPFWSSRAVCTGAAIALLFAGLSMAFRLRQPRAPSDGRGIVRTFLSTCVHRPQQVFFFTPLILLVALLALEMRSGLITVSWSALGVLVFLFALRVGERTFRLAGLMLLLLGVGKIGVVDVWRLNPRDRYVTLICMGSALLLVSFLYSRYREAIRKYL